MKIITKVFIIFLLLFNSLFNVISQQQTPYHGVPFLITKDIITVIQAEDFDIGGEGISYHDETPGNIISPPSDPVINGVYRNDATDNVDIEPNPTGQHIAYIASGEWLKYIVQVDDPGYYNIYLYTASASPKWNHSLHIEFDGVDKTGIIDIPDNMVWDSFVKNGHSSMPIKLEGNERIMRIYFNGSDFNLDKIEIEFVSAKEPVIPIPTDHYISLEAEDGAEYNPMIVKSDQSASQQIYIASYKNDTINYTPQDNYGSIVFDFIIPEPGEYKLWTRVITPNTDSDSYSIKMDNDDWETWEDIFLKKDFPYNWEWVSYDELFNLNAAGEHSLTIVYREPYTQLDKILLVNTEDPDFVPEYNVVPVERQYIPNSYKSNVVDENGHLKVVDKNGRLQTEGEESSTYHLCNQAGNPIQLKGICTHGIQWFPLYDDMTVPNVVEFLNIDILRIAMYVEDYPKPPHDTSDFWNGYLAHPEEIMNIEKMLIDDAIAAGIYVIIDWHIHNDPMEYIDDAKYFFKEMAETYGRYPNVIFEICNEPIGGVEWSTIKSYAEEIIPIIRNNDNDPVGEEHENIIIVGTPNWCQDPESGSLDPIIGYNNIMYTLHYYAKSHGQDVRDDTTNAITKGLPVIVTEFGTTDYDVSQPPDFTQAEIWMDWMNDNNISWINWSLGNKHEPASILKPNTSLAGPWTIYDLTDSGVWIKERLSDSSVPTLLGDVDNSGVVNIIDALMVAQYYVGLDPSNFHPEVADVNEDGSINILDALLISQHYVGLIDSFPVE